MCLQRAEAALRQAVFGHTEPKEKIVQLLCQSRSCADAAGLCWARREFLRWEESVTQTWRQLRARPSDPDRDVHGSIHASSSGRPFLSLLYVISCFEALLVFCRALQVDLQPGLHVPGAGDPGPPRQRQDDVVPPGHSRGARAALRPDQPRRCDGCIRARGALLHVRRRVKQQQCCVRPIGVAIKS